MRVFERLLDLVFPPRETERALRGLAPDALLGLLTPKEIGLAGGTATALLPYRGSVQAAVIEAKYHDSSQAQAMLGEALAEYLLEFASEEAGFAGKLALVPVPLSARRRADRRYNQVERICRAAHARLADTFDLMPAALARVRDTAPQTRLSGQLRRENMHGAFVAGAALDASYTYIVVDDVITTGATMEAALTALYATGAHAFAVALAH